ncbi:unnamed protein product [Lathyrus oleraceus]
MATHIYNLFFFIAILFMASILIQGEAQPMMHCKGKEPCPDLLACAKRCYALTFAHGGSCVQDQCCCIP